MLDDVDSHPPLGKPGHSFVKAYAPKVAFAIVVANMVGTGVFTSLGFQLLSLSDTRLILLLWAVGGLCALCGALCYAELGVRHPESGGEYHFLSVLVHPYAGFVSGLVSATVGFAAPVALAALTFGNYLKAGGLPLEPRITATGLIALLVLLHARTRRDSASGQVWLTALKLALIALFIVLALVNTMLTHSGSSSGDILRYSWPQLPKKRSPRR